MKNNKKGKIILTGMPREFNLSKIAKINVTDNDNQFIYFEKIKGSDNWRLTFTNNIAMDVSDIGSIDVVID